MNQVAATVLLWLLCLLKRLFGSRADRLTIPPARILVAQMAKLGDMICTTPVFRAIKKRYPNAHLTVMGNSINREVLQGNSDIDEYFVFDGLVSVYKKIRKGEFDTAVTVVPDVISAALCYLAGIHTIIVPKVVNGYSPFESFWYRSLRTIAGFVVHELRMGSYTPGEYVHLLEPLGIQENDTTKHLTFSPAAADKAKTLLKDNGSIRVGISPSAGNKDKNWGAKKFAELAHQLAQNFDVEIVLFGGKRDRSETKEMRECLDSSVKCVDLSEKLSIDELKAAIALLDLFVAVDTGPIYIAEAFRIPTVDILGPMTEGEQAPEGEWNIVVSPPSPRVPQMHTMNVYGDFNEMKRQIDATTIESVYSACAHLLNKIQNAKNS
jgi:heptosyltransferase II